MSSVTKKVAIVGTSCSGVAALWALQSTPHEVHVFEASGAIGGEINRAKFRSGANEIEVETQISLFNEAVSPNLLAFLKQLGIPPKFILSPFAFTMDDGALEWPTWWPFGMLTSKTLCTINTWSMLVDAFRFYYFAEDELRPGSNSPPNETIAQYLRRKNYSPSFSNGCLFPVIGALWSSNPEIPPMDMPAKTIIGLVRRLGLFSFLHISQAWYSIPNGVKRVSDAIISKFPPDQVHLNSEVKKVTHDQSGRINLRLDDRVEVFDFVILAIRGDKARAMCDASDDRLNSGLEFLDGYHTRTATIVLHSDATIMPKDRALWSAATYSAHSTDGTLSTPNFTAGITYWMNCIQEIPESTFGTILMSVNPFDTPYYTEIQYIGDRQLPTYSTATLDAQKRELHLKTPSGIGYCGLWAKTGYSEDGVTAGLEVAQTRLGAVYPFRLQHPWKEPIPRITRWGNIQRLIVRVFFVLIRYIQLFLYILGRFGLAERKLRED